MICSLKATVNTFKGLRNIFLLALAPTGAQGVTMCVRPSVRLSVRYKVENLHLLGSNLQAISQE